MSVLGTLKEMATLDIDAGFKEVLAYDVHPQAPDCDADAFERVVESRRSVRLFEPNVEVPEAVMQRCLDLAVQAPNSSNLQPWEFYWVRSPDQRQRLVDYCMQQPPARTASELLVCVARTATWRRNCQAIADHLAHDPHAPRSALKYYQLACPLMYEQAANAFSLLKHVLFNVQGWAKPIPREPNFGWGMQLWATKSVCLAAATFMLAVRAHGFDSCPMEGCDQVRIKHLLHLPRDARVVMVIAVGKRQQRGVYGARLRLDRSWFVKTV